MANSEKNMGVPIDDDALDGVSGGVNLLPLDGLDQIKELIQSGEPLTISTPVTENQRVLVKPEGTPGTVSPLDSEATRIAEEFRHGMNLGGLPVNTK